MAGATAVSAPKNLPVTLVHITLMSQKQRPTPLPDVMPQVRNSKAPDAAEIGSLYSRHADELLGFFARRTFDPQVALDLVAETFATAFDERNKCRATDEASRRAWIYGIGRNLLKGYYRDGAIERRAMQKLAIVAPSISEESAARVERLADLAPLRVELREELANLSEEQRDAIALRVIEERPYPEIAELLNVSEEVVRTRVSRGLKSLRRAIELNEDEVMSNVLGA